MSMFLAAIKTQLDLKSVISNISLNLSSTNSMSNKYRYQLGKKNMRLFHDIHSINTHKIFINMAKIEFPEFGSWFRMVFILASYVLSHTIFDTGSY